MPEIEKSALDKREYDYFVLPNGLKVLVVSDQEISLAAAALMMPVGSHEDSTSGVELAGLAHFLEHMLFLGTEKYPDEQAYSKYLATNGGWSNAWTSANDTCYFFACAPKSLLGALEIFAPFFICPLFTESATERELNAVDNEHKKNLQNDFWRANYVRRYTSNPAHPASRFHTGDLRTLRDEPRARGVNVREALIAFHARHYSSNYATLAVCGKESVAELRGAVEAHFTAVPNKSLTVATHGDEVLTREQEAHALFIVPLRDVKTVALEWVVPRDDDDEQNYHYLSNLIGHEGAGSALSLLKARGLATELCSGVAVEDREWVIFQVEVDVTDSGLARHEEVVDIILAYMDMLRQEGPQRWLYDELARTAEIGFRFKSKEAAPNYMTHLVAQMQRFKAEHVLSGGVLMRRFNADAIRAALDRFDVARSRCVITAQSVGKMLPKGAALVKDPVYGAEHCAVRYSDELLKRWRDVRRTAFPELHLPAPNPFIPRNLELVAEPARGERVAPELVVDTARLKLWHLQDCTFKQPAAALLVHIKTPAAYDSPLASMCTRLGSLVVEEALNEFAYPADIAGLKFDVTHDTLGLCVKIKGYSDKFDVLLAKVLETIKAARIDDERFADLRQKLSEELHNTQRLQQPHRRALYETMLCMETPRWNNADYCALVDDISQAQVAAQLARIVACYSVEAFLIGNFDEAGALRLANGIHFGSVQHGVPHAASLELPRCVALRAGRTYLTQQVSPNAEDLNSAVENFYVFGDTSLDHDRNVTLEILGEFLAEEAFHVLRTKEALGYIVHLGIKRDRGLRGVRIIVQSSVHDAAYLNWRVERFLAECVLQRLDALSDAQLHSLVSAALHQKARDDENIGERFSRLRSEIVAQRYCFDRLERDIDALHRVTKASLRAAAERYLVNARTRVKFSSQVYAEKFRAHYDAHSQHGALPVTLALRMGDAAAAAGAADEEESGEGEAEEDGDEGEGEDEEAAVAAATQDTEALAEAIASAELIETALDEGAPIELVGRDHFAFKSAQMLHASGARTASQGHALATRLNADVLAAGGAKQHAERRAARASAPSCGSAPPPRAASEHERRARVADAKQAYLLAKGAYLDAKVKLLDAQEARE